MAVLKNHLEEFLQIWQSALVSWREPVQHITEVRKQYLSLSDFKAESDMDYPSHGG